MTKRNASRQDVREDGKNDTAASSGKERVRKTHLKSRGGCGNCKRRRVKCDETKPACERCTSFAIHCDYLPDVPQPGDVPKPAQDATQTRRRGRPRTNRHLLDRKASDGVATPDFDLSASSTMGIGASHVKATSSGPAPVDQTPAAPTSLAFELQIPDMELLHHYILVTSNFFSPDEIITSFYKRGAIELGYSNPFVLRLLLAFTAYHLASEREYSPESKRRHLEQQGETHLTAALEGVRAIVPHMDKSNCQAIYIAAQLIALTHLGAGPKPGEYIAFGNDGATTWLHLLRGVRSIREVAGESLFEGVLAPLGPRSDLPDDKVTPRTATREYKYSYEKPLSELRERVERDPQYRPFFSDELKSLEDCFFQQCEKADGIIFAWLYRTSDEYVASVHAKNQIALAIFAYFAVLMLSIEDAWFAKGWPRHILEGVKGELDEEHLGWIEWPLNEVGTKGKTASNGSLAVERLDSNSTGQ